jgi:hypothetical protein
VKTWPVPLLAVCEVLVAKAVPLSRMLTVKVGLQVPAAFVVCRTCTLQFCRPTPAVSGPEGFPKLTRTNVSGFTAPLLFVSHSPSGASGSSSMSVTAPAKFVWVRIASGARVSVAANAREGLSPSSAIAIAVTIR